MNIINNMLGYDNFFGSPFFIVSMVAIVVLAAMVVMLEFYYRKRAEAQNAAESSAEEQPESIYEEEQTQPEEAAAPEEKPEEPGEETPEEEVAEAEQSEQEEAAEEVPQEEEQEEPEEEGEQEQPELTGEVAAAAVLSADAASSGIRITQRKSFIAKLVLNRELIPIYEELKNFALSYKKVKSLISFKCEKFSCGRKILMRFFVKGKRLYIYYATTPEGYPTKYRLIDVSDKGIGKQLPTLQKVLSTRSVKYAKEMIAKIMEQNEIPLLPPDKVKKPAYSELLRKRSVSKLIDEGLIKVV